MKLEEFKRLHKYFNQLLSSKSIEDLSEAEEVQFHEYNEALHSNKECSKWYLLKILKQQKFNYKKHCCLQMAYHLSEGCAECKAKNLLCSDIVIDYWPKKKEYGLPIHDGGFSHITIQYCPWCGKKIGKEKLGLRKLKI